MTQYEPKFGSFGESLPDVVNFGGEFSFRKSDDLATVLNRLFNIGCDIGGLARRIDPHTIKVTGCYNRGYWELHWLNPSEGITMFTYMVPVEA